MSRGRCYNKYISYIKAVRKKNISDNYGEVPYYNNLHQYSKNKIHCSCFLCSSKTKNYGCNNGYNYSINDIRKLDKLNYSD